MEVKKSEMGKGVIQSLKALGMHKAFDHKLLVDPCNNFLRDDTLTILCEISWVENEKQNNTFAKVPDSPSRFLEFDEYENIFLSENFSDVTLSVDNKMFPAHKNILAARSSVFKAMFSQDVLENNQSVVEIKDVKHEVFRDMLQFIYIGKVTDITTNAKDLLMAADKYALEGLKAKCEKELFQSVTVDNTFEYLHLADTYNAPKLMAKIIGFIKLHLKEVVVKPMFKEYTVNYRILM